jgi:hypothetical protein
MTPTGKTDRKTKTPIQKPQAVIDYNNSMNAVDRQDQQLSSFPLMRRYSQGHKKILVYLMDIGIFNSYVLLKKVTRQKSSFNQFRIQLAEDIIEQVTLPAYPRHGFPQSGICPVRLQAAHWAHFVTFIPPNPIKKTPSRSCVVCKSNKKKSETQYECEKCLVALHIPECFRVYHTNKNF